MCLYVVHKIQILYTISEKFNSYEKIVKCVVCKFEILSGYMFTWCINSPKNTHIANVYGRGTGIRKPVKPAGLP